MRKRKVGKNLRTLSEEDPVKGKIKVGVVWTDHNPTLTRVVTFLSL